MLPIYSKRTNRRPTGIRTGRMGPCVRGAGMLLMIWAGGAVAPAAWNATGSLACAGEALREYTSCMGTCDLTCNSTTFARCDVEVPAGSTSSLTPPRLNTRTTPHTHRIGTVVSLTESGARLPQVDAGKRLVARWPHSAPAMPSAPSS